MMDGERVDILAGLTDEELDRRCRPVAMAVALSLLRGLPKEDAEECVNDVMLRLLTRRESYEPSRGTLETFVRVMTRTEALSRLRREKPASLPLREELYLTGGPEEYIGDIVEKALDSLSRRERQLFTLRFLYGMESRELARRLGMSRGGVDVAVLRLRRKLRGLLERQGIQVEGGRGRWKSGD